MTAPTLSALRARCPLHLPDEPGYNHARVAWNLAAEQRPAAVAAPRSVDEVRDVVRTAAAEGLRVAPQTTGHGAAPLAERGLDDVVLVRLGALTGVTVDPAARTARVLGGSVWSDVLAATAPHGLTAVHGSAPDVGVVGYLLAGGLSFYGRTHGLAVNSVRSVEIVTAEGILVHASAEVNPDLFWAVRGGGGNYGVVVAIEIALLPYADVFAGMMLWDVDRAADVAAAWSQWTRSAPDAATTSFRVMSFPPLPELPPFLSGRDVVIVDGAILADDDAASALLAPLRELGPELDTFGRMPAPALLAVHLDPPAPTPTVADHVVLDGLPDDAVRTFVERVGRGAESGLMFAELRHLGGALRRSVAGGGALDHVAGEFALLCVAVAPTPQAAVAGRAAAFAAVRAMAPWARASLVPTFTETHADPGRFFDSVERMRSIRTHYSGGSTFVGNHAL